MLEVRIGGVVCRFSLLFPAMVAVAVTLDPSVFSLWCLAASLMHEMGHLIALLAFDCKPKRMVLGLFGIRPGASDTGRTLWFPWPGRR